MPGTLDHYLARTAYRAQQTDEPDRAGRAGNLFEPVGGDPGAQGRFGDRAQDASPALWAEENRDPLFAAAVAAAAAIGLVAALRRRSSRSVMRAR